MFAFFLCITEQAKLDQFSNVQVMVYGSLGTQGLLQPV